MATEIDLREYPEHEHGQLLYDVLEGATGGTEFHVIADADVDAHLYRFQVAHDYVLEWEHDGEEREYHSIRVRKKDPDGPRESSRFDVRDLEPQRRHEILSEMFDQLDPGEGFVLINDHDPKSLFYEFRSNHGDVLEWEYLSREAGAWRVELEKTDRSDETAGGEVTRYDLREIPVEDRNETIHHRYGTMPDGGTMELVAPHDPDRLREEFRERYGDAFRWEVVGECPDRCRVRVTKQERPGPEWSERGAEAADSTSRETVHLEHTGELDVRDLLPARRHERVFDAYADLDLGEGLVLLNDRDPEPLYHQFTADVGDEFYWKYLQRGPSVYRVLIGKTHEGHGEPPGTGTRDPPR